MSIFFSYASYRLFANCLLVVRLSILSCLSVCNISIVRMQYSLVCILLSVYFLIIVCYLHIDIYLFTVCLLSLVSACLLSSSCLYFVVCLPVCFLSIRSDCFHLFVCYLLSIPVHILWVFILSFLWYVSSNSCLSSVHYLLSDISCLHHILLSVCSILFVVSSMSSICSIWNFCTSWWDSSVMFESKK